MGPSLLVGMRSRGGREPDWPGRSIPPHRGPVTGPPLDPDPGGGVRPDRPARLPSGRLAAWHRAAYPHPGTTPHPEAFPMTRFGLLFSLALGLALTLAGAGRADDDEPVFLEKKLSEW